MNLDFFSSNLNYKRYIDTVSFPLPPTSHEHHFFGATKGLTRLIMKIKYFYLGLNMSISKQSYKVIHKFTETTRPSDNFFDFLKSKFQSKGLYHVPFFLLPSYELSLR